MKNKHYQRGGILVESAIVVSAIFVMLFGTLYVAIIGFDQMAADGASYEVAHQTSVSSSAAPNAYAHSLYPNIPTTQISAQLQAAPASSPEVDYGYNDANSDVQIDSVNNRHGGVAIMQGTEVTGVTSKRSASILGMPITVLSSAIEPMWLENGLHFNAQNSNSYGSTAPVCTQPTTPPNGTPPPPKCFQGSVFTAGENAPPYYVGYNFMTHCQNTLPYGTFPGQAPDPGDCMTSQEGYTPLGVAEFLDFSNWCGSTSTGSCTVAPAKAGIQGSAPADATFATVSCHQRVYATIASFFVNNTSISSLYNSKGYQAMPYGWYLYNYGNTQATFQKFAGLDSTFTTYNSVPSTIPGDNSISSMGKTDAAIREVYNWDAYDIGLGDQTLYPGRGC